jgi:hypothetical protein
MTKRLNITRLCVALTVLLAVGSTVNAANLLPANKTSIQNALLQCRNVASSHANSQQIKQCLTSKLMSMGLSGSLKSIDCGCDTNEPCTDNGEAGLTVTCDVCGPGGVCYGETYCSGGGCSS